MEEEDDDFYDTTDSVPAPQEANNVHGAAPDQVQDDNDVDDEEVEVEEDEDEFNIITDAPADAHPAEVSHPRHTTLRNEPQRPSSADSSLGAKSATPSATPRPDVATPTLASAPTAKPTTPQKPGSAYPAIHSSTIDVNGNPVHPATGKTILATDMDTDFPTDDKPWRRPGSDISDYFNYGFDEFTWVSYCLKQQEVRKEVGNQKKQMDDMQSFLGMGMPPMPGAPAGPGPPAPPGGGPPAMGGMPGMPDMSPDVMQAVLGNMMAQGMDPSTMDNMTFMQAAQAIMGSQSGGGQQGQPGYGGQGQGQMGYGSYDQRGGYGGRGRGRRW